MPGKLSCNYVPEPSCYSTATQKRIGLCFHTQKGYATPIQHCQCQGGERPGVTFPVRYDAPVVVGYRSLPRNVQNLIVELISLASRAEQQGYAFTISDITR